MSLSGTLVVNLQKRDKLLRTDPRHLPARSFSEYQAPEPHLGTKGARNPDRTFPWFASDLGGVGGAVGGTERATCGAGVAVDGAVHDQLTVLVTAQTELLPRALQHRH